MTRKMTAKDRRWYEDDAAVAERRAAGYLGWSRGEGQAEAADKAERARYAELAGVYAEHAAYVRSLLDGKFRAA